ncbi:MAG: polyhydroxyalkanoic acid system family protein [Sphingobium sp.]|nr:polyhydroxyalkanoic acid system family protein [Sphingobium sp.]
MEIDIPHGLGKDEAKRRIEQGLPKLEQHIPGGGSLAASWPSPYALEMTISAMGQKIPIKLDVLDDKLAGDVSVPVFLKMMSGQVAEFVKTSAGKMLDKA